jgi:hypothetical protein
MIESLVSRVNVYFQNLGAFELVNEENLRSFLMRTQTIRGGFGKDEESSPGQFFSKCDPNNGRTSKFSHSHLPCRRTTLLHGTRYTVLDERAGPYRVGRCPQYTNCCCQSLAQTSSSSINRNAFWQFPILFYKMNCIWCLCVSLPEQYESLYADWNDPEKAWRITKHIYAERGLNCASSGIFRRDFHGACSLHLGNIPATILLQDAGLCHQQLAWATNHSVLESILVPVSCSPVTVS